MSYLMELGDRFPGLPPGVMLKVDLLRSGVRPVTEIAIGNRYYHQHDQKSQAAAAPHRQGSVQLPDGSHVFVTQNPHSPFALRVDAENRVWLTRDGERSGNEAVVCQVTPGPQFQWTSKRSSRGTPLGTVFTPSLGGACGPIAAFLLRHCEFTVKGEECKFCSWVRMGKSVELRPDVGDMREALTEIHDEQGSVGYLAFSGGSLFNRTKEANAFVDYLGAARETGAALPPTVAAIQALDRPDSIRLRDVGFDYVAYSMEVWSDQAWAQVVPGKVRSVGREGWMDCLKQAVDVFGPGRVLCNFVAGVETAAPGVFRTPEDAAESTLEGMRWCYENGIYPKYTVWIVPGGAAWGQHPPAPLEYYARFLPERQALFSDYALAVPQIDCVRCLTESCEADLARLDPSRFARGAAGTHPWETLHPAAARSSAAVVEN
jgi:hypothetical protein